MYVCICVSTVSLQIFGIVLFSVVNGFTEIKKTIIINEKIHEVITAASKNTETKTKPNAAAIVRCRNFNAPKNCKIYTKSVRISVGFHAEMHIP